MNTRPANRLASKALRVTALAIALLAFAGCKTNQPKPQNYAVFPLPPDEPRIQFLTSFSSETELGGQSDLTRFIVGRSQIHRPIWKPYGITATKGELRICDTQPCNVVKVDLKKRRIAYLRPTGQAAMRMPLNVALDKDGNHYVTDTVRGQVLIYSKDDELVATIGKKEEMKPCGIAIKEDKLFVTDLKNHCVRVYRLKTRELLSTFPEDPKNEDEKLLSPTNIAIDDSGKMYVSDTGAFTVKVYDPQGKYVRSLGERGLRPGRFALPKGVAVDREGRAYVVDAATGLAQVFDDQGRLLMFFGESKNSGKAAMYLPAGIAVDYENTGLFQKYAMPGYKLDYLIFVINQAGRQKVNVYGFLRKA